MPNDKIDPLEGHVPRVTKNELLKMDFSAIEGRVFASEIDAALALPRHHPMRFALLYGCGRDYFRRAALATQYDAGASRVRDIVADAPAAVKLETDILLFERWQSQEAGRIRRENAAIAYAAAEAGSEPSIRRRRSTGYQGTITGRFSSRAPSFKNIDRTGRVYDLEPESDIERDRR